MKASVVREFGGGFHTEEVAIAEPRGREVLVQVKASGLCHSDELAANTPLGYEVPMVLGHEVSGVVTAVGPDVVDLAVGDDVVACLVQYCGSCAKCLIGRVHLCEHPEFTVRAGRLADADGNELAQGMGLGGFAEFALIHENQLAKIPDAVPFPQAALLGCGVVTGAGAVGGAGWVGGCGAMGAMGFTIGKFGIQALSKLGMLMVSFYLTCFIFVIIVIGAVL